MSTGSVTMARVCPPPRCRSWPRRCMHRSGRSAVGAMFAAPVTLHYHGSQSPRGKRIMKRREVLKSALAGATALAAPRIVAAQGAKTITFVPHADLVSLDPVWTTADITRNYSLAVYDTLYGFDADFKAQPQMAEG